jgi:hypothetical protein
MTTGTEKKAEDYLLRRFKSKRYRFEKPKKEDEGFDLWLIEKTKKREKRLKAELKSTAGTYKTRADIRANLVFNHKKQVDAFWSGESVIVRVFLGSSPPKVILVPSDVLGSEATIKQAPRYEFSGKLDYTVVDELT